MVCGGWVAVQPDLKPAYWLGQSDRPANRRRLFDIPIACHLFTSLFVLYKQNLVRCHNKGYMML